jgi:hypothetical protein
MLISLILLKSAKRQDLKLGHQEARRREEGNSGGVSVALNALIRGVETVG